MDQFFYTTIGKKILVAITGLFMIVFLIAHLAGNLEIYSGPKALNDYSAFLRTMPKILWSLRIILLLALITHVYLTISLSRLSNNSRPVGYALKTVRKASISSRTMMLSGLTVLAFVLYHLSHYTWGIVDPELMGLVDEQGRHNTYNMLVMGFSSPIVCGFYILAQVLLAFHLSHGFSSTARTLGVKDPDLYQKIRIGGIAFSGIVALLYISIPCSVLFGFIVFD
jgi:succinate dehydrogenase / fumarate reductase cytochrome b subunit